MSREAARITVATLNLRNISDRWPRRAGLLIDQFLELEPDVIGLQEIRRPARQATWLQRRVNARLESARPPYHVFTRYKIGFLRLWEGIAIMSRLPVLESDWLDLRGGRRVAQRVRVALPGGGVLDFYNTHLHHPTGEVALRVNQARHLMEWMAERPDVPQVLTGDFNAEPDSLTVRLILERLRSAYYSFHGAEPAGTVPTPLSRSYGAPPKVIDFIFVNDRIDVHEAWVTFDRPHPDDPRLYASDHFGLAATISVRDDQSPA